ncbi:H(+)/Cl(-) exchange transporter 6-like [Clavelina lepadiformis]|uniref:H(+)/Cl(-) exchange transporter 6-like n=1 Tax=Clavelina lepadiformis TaxID=159417 RepID=UPI0040434582
MSERNALCCMPHSSCCRRRQSDSLIQPLTHFRRHAPCGKDYESLDYDQCYNKPYRKMTEDLIQQGSKWYSMKKEALSWLSIFFVGFFTALVAFFIDAITRLLTEWKLSTVTNTMETCSHWGCLSNSLGILILFNASFVLVAAALVVFGEPLAAGSGIPEIKCYLNGVKVQHVIRLWTLFCKAVGVLFSVSGGLLVGKEGPMIHSGGVIGAGVPQFESLSFRKFKLKIPFFRSDREKRDFVSAGAAAGVAAAFGAPIGGVLFSLEEGSSFWNQSLTWKTLFCTMTSTFTLNFFLSGTEYSSWGSFYQNGLLTFGLFQCPPDNKKCHLWTAGDLLIFILIGCGGGFFGMVFNFINTKLTLFRLKYIVKMHKFVRIFEALLIGVVTTLVLFLTPAFIGECKDIVPPQNSSFGVTGNSDVQRFLCQNGTYNDMASLFFNTQEEAIKQLFHNSGEYSLLTLGLFFLLFYLLCCWTYGSSVPSGLFVPCILCGAAYGRFVATVLQKFFGMEHIYLGTFSLIGAAAFLGGVVRMTISLTVILIECTNEISLSLPIMVTLMVAKWIGDLGNVGLYDIHINLKHVPLLEWEAPHLALNYTAADIMNTRLSFVYPYTRVRSIFNLLSTTAHNAFPVVTLNYGKSLKKVTNELQSDTVTSTNLRYRSSSHVSRKQIESERAKLHNSDSELFLVDRPNENMIKEEPQNITSGVYDGFNSLEDNLCPMTFHGMVLRSHLIALLKQNVSYSENDEPTAQNNISYESLNADYPRFPSIHDLDLENIDMDQIMDVSPYMHPCPYVVHPDSPVPQVFNLFRTMGLRHLPVINSSGEVIGLITRHNLTHEYLSKITKHAAVGNEFSLNLTSVARD